jgi:hypothetical protein
MLFDIFFGCLLNELLLVLLPHLIFDYVIDLIQRFQVMDEQLISV